MIFLRFMSKKFIISLALLNIIAIYLIKIWLNPSWHIGGHDTFQYIHWATTLFTEDRSLVFFRPFLYVVINFVHSISNWSSYTFEVFLYTCTALTTIIIFIILKQLKVDLFARLLSIIIFLSTLVFLEGDIVGFISSFEVLLISLAVLYSIKIHKNPNNKLYMGIFIIIGLLLSFTHEEKSIFFSILLILTLLEYPKKIFYCLSIYVLTAILFIILLQDFDLKKILFGYAGAAIGRHWGDHANIFQNYFTVLNSSLWGYGPIFSNIFKICAILVFVKLFQLLKELFLAYKLNSSWKIFIRSEFLSTLSKNSFIQTDTVRFLIIPSFLYILAVSILFNGMDLPRVTGPVTFFFVLGFFNIFYKKFVGNNFYI